MIQKEQGKAGGCGESFMNLIFQSLAVLLAVVLFACGGGGGGGGGGDAPAPGLPDPGVPSTSLQYTGTTSMATIDGDNAVEMAVGALGGGPSAYMPVPLTVSLEGGSGLVSVQSRTYFTYRQALENVLAEVGTTTLERAIQTSPPETTYGTCGGSRTMTLYLDDQTGDFTGSVLFSDFCNDGVTQNGLIGVSGKSNLALGEVEQMTMYFGEWMIDSASWSVTVGGSFVGYPIGTMTLEMTVNYLIKDNFSGKVYEVKDYLVREEEGVNWEERLISGLYYHPDYGYVEVGTITPFLEYTGDYGPFPGELEVDGTGLTRALLTCLSSLVYQVKADTTGDQSYDWNSGTLHWPDANTPPVANAGSNQTVSVGSLVTLDGSGSSDFDGDVLTYSWTFTSVLTGELSDPTIVNPTFTANEVGVYEVELTVSDGFDSAVDQVSVTAQ